MMAQVKQLCSNLLWTKQNAVPHNSIIWPTVNMV